MIPSSRIILGIDPGTVITGYALLEEKNRTWAPLDFGLIRPSARAHLSIRYLTISQSIRQLIQQFRPTELAIETPFVDKNPQSAIKLGGALSCALVAAREAGMEVFGYSPSEVKKGITGNGSAAKEEVQLLLKAHFCFQIAEKKLDATDALSIALYHALQPNCIHIQKSKIL